MDLAQTNKLILIMKPFITGLICYIISIINSRKIILVIISSVAFISIGKIKAFCLTVFSLAENLTTQTIEIVDSGRSVIEIIIYVVTSLATIYGIFKGWGWFKNRNEKRKSIYEENTALIEHVNEMKNTVLNGSKEVLELTVNHHKELMIVTQESQQKDLIIREQRTKLEESKLKCNNNCHE